MGWLERSRLVDGPKGMGGSWLGRRKVARFLWMGRPNERLAIC
jgi:hypothetical protein